MEIKGGENALPLLLGTRPNRPLGTRQVAPLPASVCMWIMMSDAPMPLPLARQFILSGRAMIFSGYGTEGVEFRVTAGIRQHIANPRSVRRKETAETSVA